MILNCLPVKHIQGRITVESSKSYSIRAFIIAARGGVSSIKNASGCQDAQIALKLAKSLGASVNKVLDNYHIKASHLKISSKTFLVGESGTSLRFLLPLLALHTQHAKVLGQGTLIGRPNAHLCTALREQGMKIKGEGTGESVPITYEGGFLKGGIIRIDGSLSSQFISALLIALPSLDVDTKLMLTGKEMVSQDYIHMTIQILAKAGILIKKDSARIYQIKGKQVFKGLKNFSIPSDYGLAAFPLAAGAILPSNLTLAGHWDDELIQSDGHIMGFLKRMGVNYEKTSRAIKIKGPFDLRGGIFNLKNCPDLVPIMSVLALFAKGKTQLVGIHHARAKESDRISDLRQELLKVGANVTESPDALTIIPEAIYKNKQVLYAHHDHRLAMAFTVLGAKIGCRVDGIESVKKSYPGFVSDMKALGVL